MESAIVCAVNPTTPRSGSGSYRVFRGGSWINDAGSSQVAFRNGYGPDFRFNILGFRLSRTIP